MLEALINLRICNLLGCASGSERQAARGVRATGARLTTPATADKDRRTPRRPSLETPGWTPQPPGRARARKARRSP
eukprot:scaffold668_cov385-Prasinococcus_capsulatus_cf.AAC.9